jgi:hypothetical protein
MALKDKVLFQILVDFDDLSTILFKPIGEVKNNKIYTLNLKDIELSDGTFFSDKINFVTPLDNYFVPVRDVKEHITSIDVPDEIVMKHIIHAGRAAMYYCTRKGDGAPPITPENIKEDYYPFYMYIKNHAIVDILKDYYIEKASGPKKWTDTLSDLSRSEEMDFDGLKELIKTWEEEAEMWLDLVVTITADPKWALRGKYSYALFNSYAHPYHHINWNNPCCNGFKRGF